MKISFYKACSDLGVHVCGSEEGPIKYNFDDLVDYSHIVVKDDVVKELDKDNKHKNLISLNRFNRELYRSIVSDSNFSICAGGDHSIAIASSLASIKKNPNIGIIWVDAHADFHTFESTISGNIHGMPFATVCGVNGDRLTEFFDGEYFNPKNAVLVCGRDIEDPEFINLEKAGVKVFTTADIKKYGVKNIMEQAIKIITDGTCGYHVSYDLDAIDPLILPGVSIKASNGINLDEGRQILDYLLKGNIKSFDLVELNPSLDKDNVTLDFGNELINKVINKMRDI